MGKEPTTLLTTLVQVLYNRLDRSVRPGAAGLLTGMEYSRVGSTTWVHPASNCNYSYSSRTSLRTRKLPDRLGVGL